MAKENNNKSFVLRIDAATMEALEGWAADEFPLDQRAAAVDHRRRPAPQRPPEKAPSRRTGVRRFDGASVGRCRFCKTPGSAPERLSRRYLTDTLIDMCNLLSKNRIGLCGKLRGSQSDGGMSALCPVRSVSGVRPGRGVSGLRPGQGISALRPVRSVSGVRPGRGVSGFASVGRAFPLCVRFGACPVCVRGGVCPVCVRGRAFPLLRPVRSVSGLRPVLGVSGLRPGRNMSGLRYGRIVSGLQVVGGLLVFFLLLRPDWLPRWVYWGVLALGAALALGEMALDYRRRRPRRRWRDAGLGAVVAFGGLDCHFAAVLFLGSLRREGVDPRHAGIGCRCARRMRRLPAALAAFARRG